MDKFFHDIGGGLAPVLSSALADPSTQQAINEQIASALASPEVRKSVRPIMIEASLWLAGAMLLGIATWRLVR